MTLTDSLPQNTKVATKIHFIHNPSSSSAPSHPYQLSKLLHFLLNMTQLSQTLPSELIAWLDLDVDSSGPPAEHGITEENPIFPWYKDGSSVEAMEAARVFWENTRGFVEKVGFAVGESGLVINGRVSISPVQCDVQMLIVCTAYRSIRSDRDLCRRSERNEIVRIQETNSACRHRSRRFRI